MGKLTINTGVTLTQTSPPNPTPFLDLYPGANTAYSLSRKLNSSYTGNLMQVQRTSDSAITDIGFNSRDEINTAALLSFASGGTVNILKVYDQSGNGNTVTLVPTTSIPGYPTVTPVPLRIVNSGVLELDVDIPAGLTPGSNDNTVYAATSVITANTVLSVYRRTGNNFGDGLLGTGTNSNAIYVGGIVSPPPLPPITGPAYFDGAGIRQLAGPEDFNRHIAMWATDGAGNIQIGADGTALTSIATVRSNIQFNLVFGAVPVSQNSYTGYRHEIITYPTDQSANYAAMVAEMQNYY